ncbi:hypothetical protein HLBENOHH_00418 [Aeromonas dhakensis]|uniref:three component ABC system middle component n=1 Tax=Aeromonas dhakensis TaxID=196024 RepID=UPI0036731600
MKLAYDLFAETNPAYCSYVLNTFVSAYENVKATGPEIVLGYCALPLALSGDLIHTFNGTNKSTGLLVWLQRHPEIKVELSERINSSLGIFTETLKYGSFSKLLIVTEDGLLKTGSEKTNKMAIKRLTQDSQVAFNNARLLGTWFATTGTARTALNMMGLTV